MEPSFPYILNVDHFLVRANEAHVNFNLSLDANQFKDLIGAGGIESLRENKGKVLLLALDRSGSMSGAPFNALKQGA